MIKSKAGIYCIQSKTKRNRIYIGSSKNVQRRIWRHRTELKCNRHYNQKLQRHVNKYGFDDLEFTIIERFDFISKDHLLGREQVYLDKYQPYFNVLKVAGSPEGKTMSQESRNKLSKARTGMIFSEEHCKHISESKMGEKNPNFGKERTPEHRLHLSVANTGKKKGPLSAETKKKLSIALMGHVAWNKGKKQSEETIMRKIETLKRNIELKKQTA